MSSDTKKVTRVYPSNISMGRSMRTLEPAGGSLEGPGVGCLVVEAVVESIVIFLPGVSILKGWYMSWSVHNFDHIHFHIDGYMFWVCFA